MAATNKCLARSNKSRAGGKPNKRGESRSLRRCDPSSENETHGKEIIPRGAFDCGKTKHKNASIMKFVSSDICPADYRKRRAAFLKELIASTPNVSLRAREFRQWIDENPCCSDNDKA